MLTESATGGQVIRPNAIDRMVGYFSPQRMASRMAHRFSAIEIEAMSGRSYRGATMDRQTADWLAESASADKHIIENLPVLRARSAELVRNNGLAKGVIATLTDHVVGTGLRVQSALDGELFGLDAETTAEIQRSIERGFRAWEPMADLREILEHYRFMQRLAYSSANVMGDSLLQSVLLPDKTRRFRRRLALIEGSRCLTPSGLGDENPKTKQEIRDGVEFDSMGRPEAYWILKRRRLRDEQFHAPSDLAAYERIKTFSDDGRRQMVHIMRRDEGRIDQTRGVPLFAAVLHDFYQLGRYFDAEIAKKRIAACIGLIFETPDVNQVLPGNTAPAMKGNYQDRKFGIRPGFNWHTRPGEKVQAFDPAGGDQTLEPFLQVFLRVLAAGCHMSYEMFSRDYGRTSYSSSRSSAQQTWRTIECEQFNISERLNCTAFEQVGEENVLSGRVKLPFELTDENREDVFSCRSIGPGRGHIDPVKEVSADKEALSANLTTLEAECAKRGEDWREVLDQKAREQAYAEERGVSTNLTSADPSPTDKEDEEDEEDLDEPKEGRRLRAV